MTRRIVVDGVPKPQGSKTAVMFGGRARLIEGKTKSSRVAFAGWRDAVSEAGRAWVAANGRPAPLDGPLRARIVFRLPRPKSAPKRVTLPATGADIDKISRAVLDSLTGLLYVDDARICELIASKVFAIDEPPGATIEIEAM